MVKINDSSLKKTAGGEGQASNAKDDQNPIPKS